MNGEAIDKLNDVKDKMAFLMRAKADSIEVNLNESETHGLVLIELTMLDELVSCIELLSLHD